MDDGSRDGQCRAVRNKKRTRTRLGKSKKEVAVGKNLEDRGMLKKWSIEATESHGNKETRNAKTNHNHVQQNSVFCLDRHKRTSVSRPTKIPNSSRIPEFKVFLSTQKDPFSPEPEPIECRLLTKLQTMEYSTDKQRTITPYKQTKNPKQRYGLVSINQP